VKTPKTFASQNHPHTPDFDLRTPHDLTSCARHPSSALRDVASLTDCPHSRSQVQLAEGFTNSLPSWVLPLRSTFFGFYRKFRILWSFSSTSLHPLMPGQIRKNPRKNLLQYQLHHSCPLRKSSPDSNSFCQETRVCFSGTVPLSL